MAASSSSVALVWMPKRKSSRVLLDAGEHGLAVQQRLGAVEDDLRQRALGHRACGSTRLRIARASSSRSRRHVLPRAAHLLGDVAVGAVQVAPLGRIEIDGRGLQAEPQRVHFLGELGRPSCDRPSTSSPPRATSASLSRRHQRPEGRVRLDHGHVVGVADVDGLEGGAVARADVAAPRRGRHAGRLCRLFRTLPSLGLLVHQDVVRKAGALGLARLAIGDHRLSSSASSCRSLLSLECRNNKKRIPTDAERPSESFTIRFTIALGFQQVFWLSGRRRLTAFPPRWVAAVAGIVAASESPRRLQLRDSHGIAPCSEMLKPNGSLATCRRRQGGRLAARQLQSRNFASCRKSSHSECSEESRWQARTSVMAPRFFAALRMTSWTTLGWRVGGETAFLARG